MRYSKEELLAIDGHLLDADDFAENREIFESLSVIEARELAEKMIVHCPAPLLNGLHNAMQALNTGKSSFYQVITAAHQVKTLIIGLFDDENKAPYDLLSNELNVSLFREYQSLALIILRDNETVIAERLIRYTPKALHRELAQKIAIVFPSSSLITEINAASTLQNTIDSYLMGPNPELFFSDEYYSHQNCITFFGLFSAIEPNELKSIGKKLKELASEELRGKIARQLALLSTPSISTIIDPFSSIADYMGVNEPSITSSPERLFGTPSRNSGTSPSKPCSASSPPASSPQPVRSKASRVLFDSPEAPMSDSQAALSDNDEAYTPKF